MPRLRNLVVSVLLCTVVTACAEAPDPGPRFDDETTGGTGDLTCMKHQPHAPGARYTDDTRRRTDETFALLSYYTTNGAKPYCDGAGPTAVDRQWIDLYVRFGADRENVASLLDNG
nr:hypothetical protein [uncultured bacterium]